VVFITIDALRADVVDDPANDAHFPVLAQLKRDGVVFTHASAPGSQTPTSLATMFSGRYFSEQRWSDYGTGIDRFPYPSDDPSPRFPELLSAHGVDTLNASGYVFLTNSYGVVRGFREEVELGRSRAAAPAVRLIPVLLDQLAKGGAGPAFLYTHLAEPHAPYLYQAPGGEFQRYLAAVAAADAQVGRVLHALEEHFPSRWALFVSADHGEAFGDHETHDHSKTLYEELLHVPLLARSPAFRPGRIDARVGLVDMGPTLLDLFGVSTPASFGGQSLLPLLAGKDVALTRPLLAEGRLKKALTEPDGLKVIEDPRRKTVEVYDLATDPHETRNLFDVEPARADAALAKLRAFYAASARRTPGYEPPYKP
jgi:arylsulfatase A-like enzyme